MVELRLAEWTLAILLGLFFGLAGWLVLPIWGVVELRQRFVMGTWQWREHDGPRLARGYRIVLTTAVIVGIPLGFWKWTQGHGI